MGKCSSEHREKDQKRMSALQNLTLLKLKLNLKIINKNGSRNIVRSFYYPDSSTVSKEKNIESNIKSNLEKSKIDQSVGAASFNENSQIQPMINTANRVTYYAYIFRLIRTNIIKKVIFFINFVYLKIKVF